MKNVNKKRKKPQGGSRDNVKSKRRRKFIHTLVHYARLVLVAMILWAFGWVMYEISSFTYEIYKDYRAQYEAYLARRREREADWDPRFESYRNILLIGIDKGLDEGAPAANTIIVASLDKETGEFRFMALPRGTAVPSPLIIKANKYFKNDEITISDNKIEVPAADKKRTATVKEAAVPQNENVKNADSVKTNNAAPSDAGNSEKLSNTPVETEKSGTVKDDAAVNADNQPAEDKKIETAAAETDAAENDYAARIAELERKIAERRFVAESFLKEAQTSVSSPLCAAYVTGGAKGLTAATAEFLGITLHQYVVIDLDTAVQAIDLLGGIDLYVAEPMRYDDPEQNLAIKIDRGYRHFDGKDVLDYLRYRGGELGDIGRVERQQSFLRDVYEKFLSTSSYIKWPALIDHLRRHLVTDGEVWDALDLIMPLYRAKERTPQTILLPGAIRADGRANWQPDMKELEVRRMEFFPRAFSDHMVEGEDASTNQ